MALLAEQSTLYTLKHVKEPRKTRAGPSKYINIETQNQQQLTKKQYARTAWLYHGGRLGSKFVRAAR